MHPETSNRSLTVGERDALRLLAEREGLGHFARRLGLHAEPVARAIAGLRIHAGTAALLRGALTAHTVPPSAA
jgi:hypothetical protein